MNPIPKLISKTKLLKGYRCLKNIYLAIHSPELEAPITPDTQATFDQGNRVGEIAREYYPGGTLINNKPWDFFGALNKTRELLANGTTVIYEAAFEYMGCYARPDIIVFSPDTKRWRIYEVKSTTKIKPEHYDDIGLQAWIMAKSGLPIEQISLVHLNTECRYPDLSNLFKEVDVTSVIRDNYLTIKPKVRDIFAALRQPEIPDIDIGAHCLQPNKCGFIDHCWQQKNIPELSMFDLPNIYKRQWDLYREGIIALDDARLTDLNELQERMIKCYLTGERYINKSIIQTALATWQFPLVFLDFETINPAIPRYDGCGPYSHVPFQFSAHTWQTPDDAVSHQEFLHDSQTDPRPTLIPSLLNACGDQGTIVAYYAQFEIERIRALAQYSPDDAEALLKLIDRFVDPLPLIREAIYDNAFAGSFSLKSVAPALLGQAHSYQGMQVANGSDAQRAFETLISDETPTANKIALQHAMIEYCKKDTLVMVELAKWLYEVAAN